MLPDSEAAILVLICLGLETILLFVSPTDVAVRSAFSDPLFLIRFAIGVTVALSVCFRYRRRAVTEVAAITVMASITLFAMRIAVDELATGPTIVTVIVLSMASAFAALVFATSAICKSINWADRNWTGLVPPTAHKGSVSVSQVAQSLTRTAAIPIVIVISLCGWMLIEHNELSIVPLAICGVAMMGATMAELSERTGQQISRQIAMGVGMTAIAMWASFNVVDFAFPLVALTTRWFVGWAAFAALLTYLVPKLLGKEMLDRWSQSIRNSIGISLALATGALIATLVQEGMIRVSGQTDLLNRPLFLGMAATLGLMSLMCTLAGVLSGPGFSYRDAWKLTDRQRSALIIAAQMFGGLTWFHLFLCKSPLASLGLRAYWPYVVMTLGFASVGITEWARRRGDEVLSGTLKQTALFLPLIPVIGFWLSGSMVTSLFGESDGNGWSYIQGRVSYQGLLIAAALYYGVVSFLWKSGRSRLVSIVMGNLALWVILIQTPNWEFLTHPQAWLIPPALCVLIVTHFHRESLGSSTANGIRYAATLVIYVTSTADMLIQGVGATIMGPIILITLALIGAGAGVALRVRPFLYLGTLFVFLGLISMVWHAQVQIDAVWPWWVFGIGTGIALMVGLMAIEKNKPKLRRIATSMQQWEA